MSLADIEAENDRLKLELAELDADAALATLSAENELLRSIAFAKVKRQPAPLRASFAQRYQGLWEASQQQGLHLPSLPPELLCISTLADRPPPLFLPPLESDFPVVQDPFEAGPQGEEAMPEPPMAAAALAAPEAPLKELLEEAPAHLEEEASPEEEAVPEAPVAAAVLAPEAPTEAAPAAIPQAEPLGGGAEAAPVAAVTLPKPAPTLPEPEAAEPEAAEPAVVEPPKAPEAKELTPRAVKAAVATTPTMAPERHVARAGAAPTLPAPSGPPKGTPKGGRSIEMLGAEQWERAAADKEDKQGKDRSLVGRLGAKVSSLLKKLTGA